MTRTQLNSHKPLFIVAGCPVWVVEKYWHFLSGWEECLKLKVMHVRMPRHGTIIEGSWQIWLLGSLLSPHVGDEQKRSLTGKSKDLWELHRWSCVKSERTLGVFNISMTRGWKKAKSLMWMGPNVRWLAPTCEDRSHEIQILFIQAILGYLKGQCVANTA